MSEQSERMEITSTALLAFPVRRHAGGYCDIDQCRVCLDDHMALAEYIHDVTQAPRRFHDFLGEYRTWLDNHGIPAEGEDGWATREAWDKDNVHAFIWDVWEIEANKEITNHAMQD